MTPQEQLMEALGDAVSASSAYGMTFDGTAPVVMQLGIKLSQRVLGKDNLVKVLRRLADELADPTELNVIDLFPSKTTP
jgi:hypothetical protein